MLQIKSVKSLKTPMFIANFLCFEGIVRQKYKVGSMGGDEKVRNVIKTKRVCPPGSMNVLCKLLDNLIIYVQFLV